MVASNDYSQETLFWILPPVVTQTSVGTDLLQALQILTKFVVQNISQNLQTQVYMMIKQKLREERTMKTKLRRQWLNLLSS